MGKKLYILVVAMVLLITCSSVHHTGDTIFHPHGEHQIDHHSTDKHYIQGETDQEPTVKDNAAHFIEYQDDPHIRHWREWWYLNLETLAHERLVILFLTAGDLNNPFTALAAIIMVFMREDGSTFWTLNPYPSVQYTPDYEKCNVRIGDNVFATTQKDTYQIQYRNARHSLKLDLTLTKSRQGIKHGDCTTALGDWEFMGWCIPVSFGETGGKLSYTDTVGVHHQINLAGYGYHDHNWGLIQWNKLSWDWGSFSSTQFPFSIIYGQTDYTAGQNGNINIVNDTLNYSISYPELNIQYCEWTKIGCHIRPSKIRLHGKSTTCSLDLTLNLKIPYIIGIKDIGHPYLLGSMHGSITLQNETYILSDIRGFYEFHTPGLQIKY